MYNILWYEEKLFSFLELKRRKTIILENIKHILCWESLYICFVLIWENGKVLRTHSLHGEKQHRFYWSYSPMLMKDATSLKHPNAWAGLYFQTKTHTIYKSKRRRIIFLENMKHILCWESLYTLVLIWEKGKVLRKHNLQGKKATSVLLKLFIDPYERCHISDAP